MWGFFVFMLSSPIQTIYLSIISALVNVTFHTSLAAKSIDIELNNKPLFNAQNQQKPYAYNSLLTKQLQSSILKGD